MNPLAVGIGGQLANVFLNILKQIISICRIYVKHKEFFYVVALAMRWHIFFQQIYAFFPVTSPL